MKKSHRRKLIVPLAAAATLLTVPFVGADLILLEQFDYEGVNTPLNSLESGLGWDGAWLVTGWGRNYDIGRTAYANGTASTANDRGGLEFEGLPTAGSALGRFGTAGQRQAQRTLTAASKAALTADGSTIWFSVLAGGPSNGNKYGTLVFATDPLIAEQGVANNGNLSSATGQGFGVGFRTDNGGVAGGGTGSPNAVAFINSESATVEEGTFLPEITTDPATHHDTSLIVGKINWKANGTEDELFLFNMAAANDPEPAEGDAIASLTADFDQSNFTLISLQDTGSTIYDEIRFGTAFSDVTSGVSAGPFRIQTIDYDKDTTTVTLTWDSNEGEKYTVSYSTDLQEWDGDLADGVDADAGDSTTKSFDLSLAGLGAPTQLFFRIEKE
jgi:hypothetical protein